MRVLRALTSAAALAVIFAARGAHAQSPAPWTQGARLSWVRTESAERCPDAVAVEARIRARTAGNDPFSAGPRRMIEAFVRRDHGVYFAHITVRDGDGALLGARDLSSNAVDCDALASAAAVAISLSLAAEIDEVEPTSTAAPVETAVQYAVPPPPGLDDELREHRPSSRARAPEAPAPSRPRNASREWPALRDDVGLVLHAGLLPSIGAGIGIGSQMRFTRWFRIGLTFAHLPQQETAVPTGSYAFGLTYGQIDACLEMLDERRSTLALCLGLAAGGLSGLVYERQPVSFGEQIWGAATSGARATLPIYGALEALIDLEAIVPLTTYRFQLPGGLQFAQATVAAVGRIGLGVRFP